MFDGVDGVCVCELSVVLSVCVVMLILFLYFIYVLWMSVKVMNVDDCLSCWVLGMFVCVVGVVMVMWEVYWEFWCVLLYKIVMGVFVVVFVVFGVYWAVM